MLNIGYRKKTGPSTNTFPFPAPHHAMLRHFGDTLSTCARLNIARGNGGDTFSPKDALMFQDIFRGL